MLTAKIIARCELFAGSAFDSARPLRADPPSAVNFDFRSWHKAHIRFAPKQHSQMPTQPRL